MGSIVDPFQCPARNRNALGVDHVFQGCEDKLATLRELNRLNEGIYERMAHALEKRFRPRPSWETPHEWLEAAQAALHLRHPAPLRRLTDLFVQARYSPRPLGSVGTLQLLDLSLDPRATYTLWVGLVGMAVFELGQNAIDQVVTQRALCCRDRREAQKAVYAAAFGALTFYLMAFVGLGLVAFYALNPPAGAAAELLVQQPDRVFPFFLVEQVPPGLSGLLIASIFAAGISTLDSALTALSQTTLAGGYQRYVRPHAPERHYLRVSRAFIIAWAAVLCGLALGFHFYSTEGLLNLGLRVPGYVYGALLGIALLALWRRGTPAGIGIQEIHGQGAERAAKKQSVHGNFLEESGRTVMATTWIVAADSSRARVLQVLDREQRLHEVDSLLNPDGRMKDRELITDAHPRFRGSGGPASDRQEMPAVEHSVELFAKRVAEHLDKARTEHRYDQLVVVAAPKVLGLMRKELSKEVGKLVTDELPKDLSWFNAREIERYFAKDSGQAP